MSEDLNTNINLDFLESEPQESPKQSPELKPDSGQQRESGLNRAQSYNDMKWPNLTNIHRTNSDLSSYRSFPVAPGSERNSQSPNRGERIRNSNPLSNLESKPSLLTQSINPSFDPSSILFDSFLSRTSYPGMDFQESIHPLSSSNPTPHPPQSPPHSTPHLSQSPPHPPQSPPHLTQSPHFFVRPSSGDTEESDSSVQSYNECEGYYIQPPNSTEHPLEHPRRSLFVRSINSNIEDEELTKLFEAYGPIRNLHLSSKHRGFVIITYFDIRHAKNAMRQLQSKMIGRKKLDIHYAIPKENPSERELNQGTLVVFNLDPSTTNEELKELFGKCGEIKEVRETPNKKHHKFIEFFDVRHAEKAMKTLNKMEIKGKKIKIEFSRPGGQQPSDKPGQKLPDDDHRTDYVGSAPVHSDPSLSSPHFSSQSYPPPFRSMIGQRTVGTPPTFPDSPSSTWNVLPNSPHQTSPFIVGSNYDNVTSSSPRTSGRQRSPSVSEEEKYKYALNISNVRSGDDTRTTLFIGNIPNKYNQKMLLSTIDQNHKGTYDFFYLPIDFKNKCNVGYAFINFRKPEHIIKFYEEFNNKRWEKFKSEKVCAISYARIQGREELIKHFQKSSLMTEDKRCRPLLFETDGEPVNFPIPTNTQPRSRRQSFSNSDSSSEMDRLM